MQNKTLYRQAFEELNAGTLDLDLWAMVWTRADGDEVKAKARYVKRRATEAYLVEQWRSIRTPLTWWTAGLWIAANVFYLSWCFHYPDGAGFVALVGALVGFNLPPALACAGLLWFGHHRLLLIWKPALCVALAVTAMLAVLTGIDTWNRFHRTRAFSYPVTFANGKRGAIDSDVPLTPQELQRGLDGFNQQDAADKIATAEDQQLYDRAKGMYWGQQFLRGFKAPY